MRVSVRVMMFIKTFNNISAISWQSVLLVEEIGVPRENHQPAASHSQTYHIKLYRVLLEIRGIQTLVVIGTDCTGSCKSNYHTITTTTTLFNAVMNKCINYDEKKGGQNTQIGQHHL